MNVDLDPEDVPYATSKTRINALRLLAVALVVLMVMVFVLALAS